MTYVSLKIDYVPSCNLAHENDLEGLQLHG